MLKISLFFNVLLLSCIGYLGYVHYEENQKSFQERQHLEAMVGELRAKIKSIQDKQYTVFGTPKPTFKEETLFNEQYLPPEECLAQNNTNNWVKCVDLRRKALHAWLKEYRKNV